MILNQIVKDYGFNGPYQVITELLPKHYKKKAIKVNINDLANMPEKTEVKVYGNISNFTEKELNQNLKKIEATLSNKGHSITLEWIVHKNAVNKLLYSLKKETKFKDNPFVEAKGKLKKFITYSGREILSISNPDIRYVDLELEENFNPDYFFTLDPSYMLKKGYTKYKIHNGIRELINKIKNNSIKTMPKELEKLISNVNLNESLLYVHGLKPVYTKEIDKFFLKTLPECYDRINLEKIYRLILQEHLERKKNNVPSLTNKEKQIELIKEVLSTFPFELTKDQKKVIWESVLLCLKSSGNKSLIFGDVGSGKTIVGLMLAYLFHKAGKQTAFIVPSSVLAKQHFNDLQKFFGKFISKEDMVCITGNLSKKKKEEIQNKLNQNKPLIVIGTSSVNNLYFPKLELLIIDEEQKMGVQDKEKLATSKTNIVYMTATPIPRTLASSIYTNFHIFQIKQKPANRKPRITKVIEMFTIEEIENIKQRMKNKEQTLVIVPSVKSEDMANIFDVVEKYKKIFPEFKIDYIHAQLSDKEIEKKIEEFMNGQIDILVSTSMVDSGFSNQNLSHVIIESAERFGISQLHQMRGRCGRGEKQGYCYLIPGKKIEELPEKTIQRLEIVQSSEDGFELSKKDFELRGAGELEGTMQKGGDLDLIKYKDKIPIIKNYIKTHF